MFKVRITAIRKVCHRDLMEKYENPIEHACDINEGDVFISVDGRKPEGLCDSAWESMEYFVKELAEGRGDFYDGWMKNPRSAMISCNDGFRPVSFYIETIEDHLESRSMSFFVRASVSSPGSSIVVTSMNGCLVPSMIFTSSSDLRPHFSAVFSSPSLVS
ncbi:MAG: TIGR04076 family protein [Thermoplasmata archaeon]|nr:TIGR04076 family protein [Thermoplasmata archaeon]